MVLRRGFGLFFFVGNVEDSAPYGVDESHTQTENGDFCAIEWPKWGKIKNSD
jgi:hypothetical protein